jgi:hypothetical protein
MHLIERRLRQVEAVPTMSAVPAVRPRTYMIRVLRMYGLIWRMNYVALAVTMF